MLPLEADSKPALFQVKHSAINVRGMHLTDGMMDTSLI